MVPFAFARRSGCHESEGGSNPFPARFSRVFNVANDTGVKSFDLVPDAAIDFFEAGADDVEIDFEVESGSQLGKLAEQVFGPGVGVRK